VRGTGSSDLGALSLGIRQVGRFARGVRFRMSPVHARRNERRIPFFILRIPDESPTTLVFFKIIVLNYNHIEIIKMIKIGRSRNRDNKPS
jgi:hypothetical protein